jgi:predicted N-acetyltransferase YhbS
MSTETETTKRNDTIFYLLRKECEQNQIALNLVDELKSVLFLKRQLKQAIKDEDNYIGSIEFHQQLATINSLQLRVFKALTEI